MKNNKYLLLFLKMTNLRGGEIQTQNRESSHPLGHSSNDHNSCVWARIEPDSGKPAQVFQTGGSQCWLKIYLELTLGINPDYCSGT